MMGNGIDLTNGPMQSRPIQVLKRITAEDSSAKDETIYFLCENISEGTDGYLGRRG